MRPINGIEQPRSPEKGGRASEAHAPLRMTDFPIELFSRFNSSRSRVSDCADGIHERDLARLAKVLYRSRIERRNFLNGDLLAEPTWDILLDLYISHVEGKTLRTTSVCVASNVPATTALRWIGVLEEKRLIKRTESPVDQRAKVVELSQEGLQAIRGCLEKYWRELNAMFIGDQ